MATDLATVTSSQIALADRMADSTMLPAQYRRQPANLLWAIQYAQAIGVHPMVAITGVHVIEGKPTASADLVAGLVRRAGHKLRVTGDDKSATAQIIRCDDPDFDGFKVTWTIDRAVKAGVASKDVWRKYPAAMLRARAITEVARMACSEALHGIIYTPEEVGADVDEEGKPVAALPPPVDWCARARAALTADEALRVHRDAKAADADAATLALVVEIGKAKRQAETAAKAPSSPVEASEPPGQPAPAPAPVEAALDDSEPPFHPLEDDAAQKARDWLRAPLCIVQPGDEQAQLKALDSLDDGEVLDLHATLRNRATRAQVQTITLLGKKAGLSPAQHRALLGVSSRTLLTRDQASAEIERLKGGK
jgi:hypothetical protein